MVDIQRDLETVRDHAAGGIGPGPIGLLQRVRSIIHQPYNDTSEMYDRVGHAPKTGEWALFGRMLGEWRRKRDCTKDEVLLLEQAHHQLLHFRVPSLPGRFLLVCLPDEDPDILR